MSTEAESSAGQGGQTPDSASQGSAAELLSRLRLIEDQPLESRAAAYVQIHDELRTRLEGSDAATARG